MQCFLISKSSLRKIDVKLEVLLCQKLIISTLLQTAKMNNVDPFGWLSLTLQRIANGWSSSEIDALMPWNHAA